MSAAGPASAAPASATVIGCPAASCWAAAMVSQVARLSVPSRCSAITRSIGLSNRSRVVPQPPDQLFRGLGRRPGDHLGLLALFGRVQADDLLLRREPGRRRDLADLLL